jgi:hypothetical protein
MIGHRRILPGTFWSELSQPFAQPHKSARFPRLVGVPGFEPGYSEGALCSTGRRGQPYPPDTQTENFGGEPGNRTQSRASAWHFSNVLAYHLPRSPKYRAQRSRSRLYSTRLNAARAVRSMWHRDEDSNPMRLVWNQAALPGASRCECGGG